MIRLAILAAAMQAAVTQAPATPQRHATLCLDPLGINLGATCQRFDASLLRTQPDICQCLNTGATVVAPYCTAGEHPQAESADYDRARWAASHADGTLFGKSYKGRSFCVAP